MVPFRIRNRKIKTCFEFPASKLFNVFFSWLRNGHGVVKVVSNSAIMAKIHKDPGLFESGSVEETPISYMVCCCPAWEGKLRLTFQKRGNESQFHVLSSLMQLSPWWIQPHSCSESTRLPASPAGGKVWCMSHMQGAQKKHLAVRSREPFTPS